MKLTTERKLKFWLVTISKVLVILLIAYKLFTFIFLSNASVDSEKEAEIYRLEVYKIQNDIYANISNIFQVNIALYNNKDQINTTISNIDTYKNYKQESIVMLKSAKEELEYSKNFDWEPSFNDIAKKQQKDMAASIADIRKGIIEEDSMIRKENDELKILQTEKDSLEKKLLHLKDFLSLNSNIEKLYVKIEGQQLHEVLEGVKTWKKQLDKFDGNYDELEETRKAFLKIISDEVHQGIIKHGI